MVEEVNMDDYVPSRREEGGSRGGGHAYQEVRAFGCIRCGLHSWQSVTLVSDEGLIVIILKYANKLSLFDQDDDDDDDGPRGGPGVQCASQ